MDVRALLNKKLPAVANRREHQASRLFRIETMDLTFSNGTQATYERICGGRGAVMAVPFDGTHFYLTVEYCGGTMNYGLGLVKGKIDAGETPEQAVVRELEEEIGFGTRKVQLLKHEMTVAPGMLSLKMYPFLCEDLFECSYARTCLNACKRAMSLSRSIWSSSPCLNSRSSFLTRTRS